MKKHFVPASLFLAAILMAAVPALPAGAEAPLFAPCCVVAARNGAYRIDLSWVPIGAPDPGVSGYRIEREIGVGTGFGILAADTGSTATTYADTSLAPNTTYNYRVYTLNSDGMGPASGSAAATTDNPASSAVPGRTAGVTAAAASGSSIQVKWTAPSSGGAVAGYQVERSPEGGNDFSIIVADTASLSYTDTNLAPRATYGYRVSAHNGFGPGLPSEMALATVPGLSTAPQNVKAAAGDGAVAVNWGAPALTNGALTGYLVTNTTTGSTTAVGNVLSANITGLVNGSAYSFTVSAVNLAGTGLASAAVAATPRPAAAQPAATSTAVATSSPAIPALVTTTTSGAITTYAPGYVFTYALSLGSRGQAVTELQKRLAREGVYSGPVTGYFGLLTQGAVKAYQSKNGIDAVGGVGPLTRAKLNATR